MAVGIPDNTTQVENRIKTDVQREAPDSDPYLLVSWLRSLIAGFARRVFDFYQDLNRTELRLFPDTADEETAPKWGTIYVGPENEATSSTGRAVAQGIAGSSVNIGTTLTANENDYITIANATISDQTLEVLSITRSGSTATVTTVGDHLLASAVPVTISGADQLEYNIVDAPITVIGADTFEYQVIGSPVSPATGSIEIDFTSASVQIESTDFGSSTNLDLDSPLKLQSPIVGVDDTLNVDFGAIGGGSDKETTEAYKIRYLEKIRNPVAHFNASDIIAKAKEITGVTRVFVESSGDQIGTIAITTLTQSAGVAKAITANDHGFDDGQVTTITGANQDEYNVTNARILVEDSITFYYLIFGNPVSPATGSIESSTRIPLGQVRTFFMRDNDDNPIPTLSEVQTVKDQIDTILPANTSTLDNIVKAPTGIAVDYIFTELVPNTPTMRSAINENIAQFHEEQTTVGVNVDQDAYRAAIKNTIDTDTGDIVQSFELSQPIGDIIINSGEISIKGTVSHP